MSTLDGAVAFAEPDDMTVAIGQDLHLDVPRVRDLAFEIHSRLSEGGHRLARRRAPSRGQVFFPRDASHSLATTTGRRLQQHRVTDPPCGVLRRGDVAQPLGALRDRDPGLARQLPGGGLFPERTLDRRGWPNEDQTRLADRLGEVRVLREEPVSRMDRIAPRPLRYLDQPCSVEIALARGRRPDGVCRVRGPHVQGIAVDVAIDRDRAEPEVMAGADHAKRDLAAIRDEDRPQ